MSLTANNEVEKRVLEYVLTHASPDLMERISAEEKTIQKCWDYVTSYARKHAKGNQYCMTDEEAFGLVMHYFEDEPEGEAKRREEERLAALTPEEREAEERAKAEAEAERKRIEAEAKAKREAEEAERRKKEYERKIREQAKAEAAKRKEELANAQLTFGF